MRLAVAIALAGVSLLSAKRPISHEDLWLMRRVEAPVPSPDGKLVVFGMTEPAYEESAQISDLWIVPGNGSSPPRRLTHTKSGESGVAWSADSARIAFSARREGDETPQIYILDVRNGGEAVRLTNIATGAFSPKWSPDSRHIAFQSNVWADADDEAANQRIAAERKARKYRARVYDSFPIRQWDRWLEDTQRHVLVQAVDGGSRPKDLLGGTTLIKSPGFGGAATQSGQDLQVAWTPDSQALIFTASQNRNEAAFAEVRFALYQTGINGGEPRRITPDGASFTRPQFRPDGKALYASEERWGHSYNLERIAMFRWPAPARPVTITGDFDRSVSGYTFSPDSRTVFLTAEDAGHEKLYTVPAEGGAPVRELGALKSGCLSNLAGAVSAPQTALFATLDSATAPPELVRLDARNGTWTPLTRFNTERVAELDLPPLREWTFTSSRGRAIHNMVALPPDFSESKKYPLLVLMHGGPHSMWRDQWVIRWNYHLLARPGYIVLLTNYTGSTGFGEKFAQAISGDPLAGPAQEINEAADDAIRRFPFIDSQRQAAAGASYGGHLANWLQGNSTRYKCLISHAGLINLESQWGTSDTIYHRELGMGGPHWEGGKVWREQNPIRFAAKFKTPMLVTVGENDFRVPLNQSLENWSVLQRMKVPSRLIVFPEENHWILKGENSRFFYSEVHAWLARWLQPGGQQTDRPTIIGN